MINSKLVFLLIGFTVVIFLEAAVVTVFIVRKDLNLLIAIAALLLYAVYITPTFIDEYKAYISDKRNGIETSVLKLDELIIYGTNSEGAQPRLPIATFIDENGIPITLGGNFSKIKLVKGNRYRVSFYRYSKFITSIEEL